MSFPNVSFLDLIVNFSEIGTRIKEIYIRTHNIHDDITVESSKLSVSLFGIFIQEKYIK